MTRVPHVTGDDVILAGCHGCQGVPGMVPPVPMTPLAAYLSVPRNSACRGWLGGSDARVSRPRKRKPTPRLGACAPYNRRLKRAGVVCAPLRLLAAAYWL